jgi:hypothetical protein
MADSGGRFSTLPNELVLAICSALSDADLLALCQTSRFFNGLALPVFFSRHGKIQAAAISVNSDSTQGIPLALSFFDRFESLTCAFSHDTVNADVFILTHLVSRHPRIREVEVNLAPPAQPLELVELLFGLLFVLTPDKSGTLVILHHNTISISRRRRVYPCLADLLPILKIDNACIFVAAVILVLSSQKFLDLWTILSDPCKSKRQNDRIREDLRLAFPITSLRVSHRFLPNPAFSKWTLVAINQSHTTSLKIPSTPHLPAILPAITLPALTHLTICNNALLPFESFVEFLMRHPSLTYLTLEDYSVTYHDLTSLPPNSLPHLEGLTAPPRHIVNILCGLPSAAGAEGWSNMVVVSFPPPPPLIFGKSGDRIDPKARFEPVDFGEFNEALQAVAKLNARLSHDLQLHLQIPAGITSRVWSDSAIQGHGRPETNMHRVSSLVLRAHRNRPLDHDLLSLLPKWLELFPRLTRVILTEYLAPTQDARNRLLEEVHKALPNVAVQFLGLL